jgi:hypothetical protein
MLTWENMVCAAIAGGLLGSAVTYRVIGWQYARLRSAVVDLYYSAHWIPVYPCDAAALWAAVRDAAGFVTASSPLATTAITGQWLEWPSGVAVRADLAGGLTGTIVPQDDGTYVLSVARRGCATQIYQVQTYELAQTQYIIDMAAAALEIGGIGCTTSQRDDRGNATRTTQPEPCRPPLGPDERYYDVVLSRDASESATVTVAARTAAEADERALRQVGKYGERHNGWCADDGNINRVYLPNPAGDEE